MARQRPDDTEVQTTFWAPCSMLPPGEPPSTVFTPTVAVNPGVGPEGTVIEATGSGWPPGVTVSLGLSGPGGPQSVVADGAGNFVVSVLVLPNSGIGPRIVTGAAGDVSTTTDFLVVPATMQPPRFLFR